MTTYANFSAADAQRVFNENSPDPWANLSLLTASPVPGIDRQLAAKIDHTLLKPSATTADITRLCQEALNHGFCSVCIAPWFVPLAERLLGSMSSVRVCTVVGFPNGASSPYLKLAEARDALLSGADELDIVINIGALKSGVLGVVAEELRQVVHLSQAVRERPVVKVILETCLLSDDEKRVGALMAQAAGADFVKTSTGFSTGGATIDDVRLLRQVVGPAMGVKASGGIRTALQARELLAAGATRLGTSSGIAIVSGTGAGTAAAY